MNRPRIKKTFNQLINTGTKGFTLDLEGNEYKPNRGYAVAWKTCNNLEEALDQAGGQQYIGWWTNPNTKETFIEIVDIFESPMQAFVNAMMRKQRAIYDFSEDEVLNLEGFYVEEKKRVKSSERF